MPDERWMMEQDEEPLMEITPAVEDASSGSGADANSTLASAFPSCCGTVEPISEQPDQRSHPAAKELLADQSSHPAAKELLADQSSHPEAKELLAELSKEALVLTTGGVAGVGPTTRIHNIAMRAVKLGRKVAEQVLGAIRRCLRWALEHNNWSVLCTITLDFDAGMKDLLRSLGCPDKVIRAAMKSTFMRDAKRRISDLLALIAAAGRAAVGEAKACRCPPGLGAFGFSLAASLVIDAVMEIWRVQHHGPAHHQQDPGPPPGGARAGRGGMVRRLGFCALASGALRVAGLGMGWAVALPVLGSVALKRASQETA